jgi:pyruvate dehydrogenase E1 component
MLSEHEDVFYYLTIMNENYRHPPLPEGSEEAILKGMHRIREGGGKKDAPTVRLLGSGTILREVLAGAELLEEDHGVSAEVWSVTSFTELRRHAMEDERWNRLHPTEEPRETFVEECLPADGSPVVAATDYMRSLPDLIRPWIADRYTVLGTDGFGRSDWRRALRRFFEVDRHHVAVAALHALARDGDIEPKQVAKAIESYDIDPDAEAPWRR